MEEPLVSVIIPTYNRAHFVVQAVQSVLDQTYGNIETLVVDDGSTDATREVLKAFNGKIKYVYQTRSERSRARNEGFRRSKGDYIAFLDSDDLWLATKIEKQVRILRKEHEIAVVYTWVRFIDERGELYSGKICWEFLQPRRQALYEDLMTQNVISGSTSSVMVRRECLERAGLFDESMNSCEDLDLWRRLAEHYRFHKIEEPLVKLRVHASNTQNKLSLMAKGYEALLRKISQETPAEFQYYKTEAIIKLILKIGWLYRQDHKPQNFVLFCFKSIFDKPGWLLTFPFCHHLFKLLKERLNRRSCSLSNRLKEEFWT